jgi:hypothetical protein
MMCERCVGKGRVFASIPFAGFDLLETLPCPECNGCGQASCCVGPEAQPEPEADND